MSSLQGDLEYANSTLGMAQDKLNLTFKLMSEDSSRKQDLQMKMFDIIYNDLNKKEQARVDEMKSQISTNQSTLSDARNFAQTISASALSNGQADIAAQLTQITQPDIRSKTFAADMKTYSEKVAKLQGQIKPKPEKASVPAKVTSALVPAGLTQDEITHIEQGVRENGFDAVYQAEKNAGASPERLSALQDAYGVKQQENPLFFKSFEAGF